MPASSERIAFGQSLVIAALAPLPGLFLVATLYAVVTVEPGAIAWGAVRLAIAASLAFYVYTGRGWARLAFAVLAGLAAVALPLATLRGVSHPLVGLGAVLLASLCAFSASVLTFSPSARVFLASQRASRRPSAA